jgi:hypothetical protein
MSKKLSVLLILMMVMALVASACGGNKKKKVELKQTFKSTTGITIRYPDGWTAREDATGIQIANKTQVLDLAANTEFPSDGFGVMIMPPQKLADLGVAEDATIKDIMNTVSTSLIAGGGDVTTGDVISMKVKGEEAARLGVKDSSNSSEGFVVALKIDANTVIVAMAVAHDGKLQSYNDLAQRMLESITYTAPAS